MRFLSLYSHVEDETPPSMEEMERMGKLVEEGMKEGYLVSVEGCLPSAMGARVRRAGTEFSVTDGPFVESKEVIGGLAIIEAESKEKAIEHIKYFLGVAGEGVCEIRQLYDAGNCPGQASAEAA